VFMDSPQQGNLQWREPFNGENPSLGTIRCVFLDEIVCWIKAGAKHLESLGLEVAFNMHMV
jgi:hypothetical protein